MFEQKCNLIEATEKLKGGMFIHIHRYVNEYKEIANITVHADASYDSVYSRSYDKLNAIAKDENLSFEITRNSWLDADGTENTREKKGRTLKKNIKETITPKDADFAEAIAKVRKSIVDPKTVADNMNKVGKSVYENAETNKTYLRNVLIHQKIIVGKGNYPIKCSARLNVIANTIREMLPLGQYRTYILDDEIIDVPDIPSDGIDIGKTKKVPHFEYVALMGESVSSSSSSDNNA